MIDQTFNSRLAQLEASIHKLPSRQREHLSKLASETQQRHHEIKEAIQKRDEYMGRMQLALSYLMFDLEATKRENAQMKQQLAYLGDQDRDSGSNHN